MYEPQLEQKKSWPSVFFHLPILASNFSCSPSSCIFGIRQTPTWHIVSADQSATFASKIVVATFNHRLSRQCSWIGDVPRPQRQKRNIKPRKKWKILCLKQPLALQSRLRQCVGGSWNLANVGIWRIRWCLVCKLTPPHQRWEQRNCLDSNESAPMPLWAKRWAPHRDRSRGYFLLQSSAAKTEPKTNRIFRWQTYLLST